jgi:hypothetical protein
LRAAFTVYSEQRVQLGKLARGTADRYEFTFKEFGGFLTGEGISLLQDVNKALVERFKVWRDRANQNQKAFTRGASSLSLGCRNSASHILIRASKTK